MKTMPLSWTLVDQVNLQFIETIKLNTGRSYLPFAQLVCPKEPKKLIQTLVERFPNGFIVRGANEELKNALQKYGGSSINLGMSAESNLNNYLPSKSCTELVSYAKRTQVILKLDYQEAKKFQKKVANKCSHAAKTKVKYLFQDQINSNSKLKYFGSYCLKTKQRLGFLSLSQSGIDYFHVEQMLRNKAAPRGSMEYLFNHCHEYLRDENNARFLNLGEVPFYVKQKQLDWAMLLFRNLIKGSYSCSGLYRFKNKFNPSWKPTYWLGFPKISIKDLWEIGQVTNSLQLLFPAVHKIFKYKTLTTL